MPIVGVDYFLITSGVVKKRKELEFDENSSGDALLDSARARGEIIKCVVIRCFGSKGILAHFVPVKGANEDKYAAGLVFSAVLRLRHIEAILKGDNEKALQAMIDSAMHFMRVRISEAVAEASRSAFDHQVMLRRRTKEKSAPYDSQSNGGTEVGVLLIRGLFSPLEL